MSKHPIGEPPVHPGEDALGQGAAAGISAAATGEATLRQAGLWSDAWRELRRNPLFIGPALVITVFVAMAIVPQVFARGVDPYDCRLSRSLVRPSGAHWFGFDLQGCDYFAKVVHGARVSI
ncbi:MAG: ABC transporter permease, partial [Acidimicrobiia bacterium]